MSRRVLLTGAAGGIGRATARVFAEAGWSVIGVDLLPVPDLDGVALYLAADLAAPEEIRRIVTAAGAAGRLDALVNNAAVQILKPVADTDVEEWDRTMAINVRAPFLLAKAAMSLLANSEGSVVNVSSVHAVATSLHMAAYAASKGALLALTRAMALEFAPAGIRVNAVLPGAIDTPMLHVGLQRGHVVGTTTGAQLAELGRKTALGRVGRAEEVAESILFLADGRRSSYVTGQTLVVDGGATARLSTE